MIKKTHQIYLYTPLTFCVLSVVALVLCAAELCRVWRTGEAALQQQQRLQQSLLQEWRAAELLHQELEQKLPVYRQLQAQGLTQSPRRLAWIELLDSLKKTTMRDLTYEIYEEIMLPAQDASFEHPIQIAETRIVLHGSVRSVDQVLTLLNSLKRTPNWVETETCRWQQQDRLEGGKLTFSCQFVVTRIVLNGQSASIKETLP